MGHDHDPPPRILVANPCLGAALEDFAVHALAHAARGEYEPAVAALVEALRYAALALRGYTGHVPDAVHVDCPWCEAAAGEPPAIIGSAPGDDGRRFAAAVEADVAERRRPPAAGEAVPWEPPHAR